MATKTEKKPKLALEGSKWFVENQQKKSDLVVNITEIKQIVFISNVEDSVVTIKGKANGVVVQGVKRSGIIFDDIVANVEVINSQKVQIQANGTVPSISVDKTHGATIYIQTPEGKKVEIVTSLSSEVNVVTPGASADSDPKEQPIPQQFVTVFDSHGHLVTKPVEHVGV
eukprot:TRINITY_DN1980_c0_g2_i1.p1 TRINITY_DN1980_c0_g2~~TRINITY_DN1980_c0_g2_i1.p1  ORF type:complete len:170 (-),score=49.64 TRINITY_DN1980_c0_g2_i1:67-576(-)